MTASRGSFSEGPRRLNDTTVSSADGASWYSHRLAGLPPRRIERRENYMSNKLFVGGLSWDTNDSSLDAAFSRFGTVREAKVITDRETGRSRGFGFITFEAPADAEAALDVMDGSELDGRSIRVNIAEDKPRRDRPQRY